LLLPAELPHLTIAYDPLDMAHRDKVKRGKKAIRIQKMKALMSESRIAQQKHEFVQKKQRKLSVAYGGSPAMSSPLQSESRKKVNRVPQTNEDMKDGNYDNENEAWREGEGGEEDVEEEDFVEPELSLTQLNAMSLVASQRTLSPERPKKPFSGSSLFNALLESQVSGTTTEWELNEML
jgi:hypothetical protein